MGPPWQEQSRDNMNNKIKIAHPFGLQGKDELYLPCHGGATPFIFKVGTAAWIAARRIICLPGINKERTPMKLDDAADGE